MKITFHCLDCQEDTIVDFDINEFNIAEEQLKELTHIDGCCKKCAEKLKKKQTLNELCKSKNITKPYWSNCLVEALKVKIKHPIKTKITIIPPWYNEVFCPHFLWSDGEYDYDFGIAKPLKWYEIFCFKGYIRRYKLGFNQKWLKYRRSVKRNEK